MDMSTIFVRLQARIEEEHTTYKEYIRTADKACLLYRYACGRQALAGDLLALIEEIKQEE